MPGCRRPLALVLLAALAATQPLPLAAQGRDAGAVPPMPRPPATLGTAPQGTTLPPAADPDSEPPAAVPAMLASWLIGRTIWTVGTAGPDAPAPQDRPLTAIPDGWVEVGRINDLVIAPTGEVRGYLADIGGFLGLGVRQVVLEHDQLQLREIAGSRQFVTAASRAELEALPGLDASVLRK